MRSEADLRSPGVRRITRADDVGALAYLDKSPYENVFLSWGIATQRIAAFFPRTYVYDDGSKIAGVAFLGGHVVLAADDPAVIDEFAKQQPTAPERMIVGPRKTVERYWAAIARRHAPPRLVRGSQPLMMVDRTMLHGNSKGVSVRHAQFSEWESVALNSAAMIREELGYDPRAGSAEFDQNVRTSVQRGAWWVGEIEGRLCFYCSEGPYSPRTLQLQGIWTPPDMRRRGLGAGALYGICDLLLQKHPTLSLYVNDFNAPALRLYDALGFTHAGEFSTLLF